ncbi:MAG: hypothetical protein IJY87_01740 [Bacilli bacterium]|nr:hypothetical protein [Bacilli bacterium]
MIIEFKKYAKVKSFEKIDVKIILNDDVENPVYEGIVEKAPQELRDRYYYKILLDGRIALIYIYDDNIAEKIMSQFNLQNNTI